MRAANTLVVAEARGGGIEEARRSKVPEALKSAATEERSKCAVAGAGRVQRSRAEDDPERARMERKGAGKEVSNAETRLCMMAADTWIRNETGKWPSQLPTANEGLNVDNHNIQTQVVFKAQGDRCEIPHKMVIKGGFPSGSRPTKRPRLKKKKGVGENGGYSDPTEDNFEVMNHP